MTNVTATSPKTNHNENHHRDEQVREVCNHLCRRDRESKWPHRESASGRDFGVESIALPANWLGLHHLPYFPPAAAICTLNHHHQVRQRAAASRNASWRRGCDLHWSLRSSLSHGIVRAPNETTIKRKTLAVPPAKSTTIHLWLSSSVRRAKEN